MENYEKKYKEALCWIRKIYPTMNGCDKEDAERHFPELKESEGEMIRKELIEQVIYIVPDKNEVDDNGNTLPCYTTRINKYIAWLEKQGEQKPVDKKEPKFKVGDWLCENEPNNYARFIQILETVNVQGKEIYRISRDIHNDEDIVEFYFVEKYYHKFDIQDAKEGDVLSNGKMVVIFKHFEDPSYRQHIVAYIGLDTSGNIQITDDTWNLGVDKTKPATKEQRNLLFQKMHDAGYEWDAEKKGLKLLITNGGDFCSESENCEQKPEHPYCQEHCKGYKESGGKCYFGFDCEAKREAEKKPVWGEKDEEFLNRAIIATNQKYPMTANWLKSLKDRVQPQNK